MVKEYRVPGEEYIPSPAVATPESPVSLQTRGRRSPCGYGTPRYAGKHGAHIRTRPSIPQAGEWWEHSWEWGSQASKDAGRTAWGGMMRGGMVQGGRIAPRLINLRGKSLLARWKQAPGRIHGFFLRQTYLDGSRTQCESRRTYVPLSWEIQK